MTVVDVMYDMFLTTVVHGVCRDDINIMAVFKAMGVASEQEALHLIGADSTFMQLMLPSIQDCRREGIYTTEQALEYLGTNPKQWNLYN